MNKNMHDFAFIFDSGNLGSSFYGNVVFQAMIEGRELSKNPVQITVSLGDIFVRKKYVDIEPYTIKDEFCTLNFDALLKNEQFKDLPFCWIVENLSSEIAIAIDLRLRKTQNGYVGLTRVDKSSALPKKQFWKYTIKKFTLYGDTISVFQDPQLEGEFSNSEIALKYGYKIKYKTLPEDELENKEDATNNSNDRQCTQEIDRDLFVLNFSIRHELQISGALIWKSINALNKVNFNISGESNEHLIEYPFFTLYFASQGIERIQKAIVELICKKNHIKEDEKEKVYDLLTSHAHNSLNSWIEKKTDIKLNSNCRKLIDILTRFYNTVRYSRYSDESYLKSFTPECDLLLELKPTKISNINNDIKNTFGGSLGKITHIYFSVFEKLCTELNIFAYELEYDSAACIVYGQREPNNLYTELIKRHTAKKEVIYWLIKHADKYPKYSIAQEDALNFDAESIETYLSELILNSEDGQECYDEVDCLYDELCSNDKEKWKNRLELINYILDD